MSIGNRQDGVYYSLEVPGIFKNPMPTTLKFDLHNVIILNYLILFAFYNCSSQLPKWEYKLTEYIHCIFYFFSIPQEFWLR